MRVTIFGIPTSLKIDLILKKGGTYTITNLLKYITINLN